MAIKISIAGLGWWGKVMIERLSRSNKLEIVNFKKDDQQEEKNLNTVILLNPKNEEAVYKLALLKIRILKFLRILMRL